jgi:uncharacterized protein with HEPN domain
LSESFERWRADLDSMIAAAERAMSYVNEMTFDAFLDDTRTQDATVLNLVVLSEAAKGLPEELKAAHPEIPWRQIAGFRNRVAHSNTTVDLSLDHSVVWGILTQDLPPLVKNLRAILSTT